MEKTTNLFLDIKIHMATHILRQCKEYETKKASWTDRTNQDIEMKEEKVTGLKSIKHR